MSPFRLTPRRLSRTGLAILVGAVGCVASAPRPATRPRPAADSRTFDAAFAGLVDAHNGERTGRGLPSLVADDRLNLAAQRHAEDMAGRGRMSHRGSDGSDPFRRMERAGYRFQRAAENVAAGQTSLGELMGDWMRSPGHRRNVLGKFTGIGTGYATDTSGTPYWCVTFGTPDARTGPTPGAGVGYP